VNNIKMVKENKVSVKGIIIGSILGLLVSSFMFSENLDINPVIYFIPIVHGVILGGLSL